MEKLWKRSQEWVNAKDELLSQRQEPSTIHQLLQLTTSSHSAESFPSLVLLQSSWQQRLSNRRGWTFWLMCQKTKLQTTSAQTNTETGKGCAMSTRNRAQAPNLRKSFSQTLPMVRTQQQYVILLPSVRRAGSEITYWEKESLQN